jgi:hypothetical protein
MRPGGYHRCTPREPPSTSQDYRDYPRAARNAGGRTGDGHDPWRGRVDEVMPEKSTYFHRGAATTGLIERILGGDAVVRVIVRDKRHGRRSGCAVCYGRTTATRNPMWS